MESTEVVGLLALGGAGATVGLVEALKRLLKMPSDLESRVAPVLAIVVGILWNWLLLSYLRAEDARLETIVLFGLMSGLAASGLWSSAKATVVEPARRALPRG